MLCYWMVDQLFKMLNIEEKIQMPPFKKKKDSKTKPTKTNKILLQNNSHSYIFWKIFPDSYESQGSLVESKKPKACFWENSYFSSDASRLKTSLI